MKNDRIRLPLLLVLLAFLAGGGYLVYRVTEEPLPEGGMVADAIDEDDVSEAEGHSSDAWHHHQWGRENAEPPPGPTPSRDGLIPNGPMDDDHFDPQMAAMRRSFHVEEDGGVPLPFYPTEREASLVSTEGVLSVSPGARCQIRVLPVRTGQFNCLVRVVCDGQVLYPNRAQTAGYVPCELEDGRPISARDTGHSALDGDPRIQLDLAQGTVTISDEGDGVSPFEATLRVR